jgi:hypothetical protein
MNRFHTGMPFAALALAATISLSGCKTNTQQANSSPTSSANSPQGSAATGSGAPSNVPQANSASGQPQPAQTGPFAPAGAAAGQQPNSGAAPQQAIDLPEGTRIRVRLDQDLGSKISRPGDNFGATVAEDVQVNGQTVIQRGARAEGTVIDAKALGKLKGGAYLAIRLERVHTNWGSYPVATSSVDRAEKGKGKRSAAFIGGGAGLGALIGGLAGGGKGVAIGALAGGGAGTAGGAFTGNKQIFLPAETMLTFHLDHPVHITG